MTISMIFFFTIVICVASDLRDAIIYTCQILYNILYIRCLFIVYVFLSFIILIMHMDTREILEYYIYDFFTASYIFVLKR